MSDVLEICIGIDPGISGGIAAVYPDGEIMFAHSMPLIEIDGPNGKTFDVLDCAEWSRQVLDIIRLLMGNNAFIHSLWIEWTFTLPGRHAGAHRFAKAAGAQLLAAHMLAPDKVKEVNPDFWRGVLGVARLDGMETWKQAERAIARKLWPECKALRVDADKPALHEGKVAAALIARAAQLESRAEKMRRIGW